jgi:hypothetical protein
MAPIAAGAQDYQVCWIFKASGVPPFLRWANGAFILFAGPRRKTKMVVGKGLAVALYIRAVVNESAKR